MRVSAKTAPERPETVFEVRRSRGSTNLFVLEARARPEDQGIAMAVDTGAEVTILRQSDAVKVGAQLEPLYDSEVRAVGSTLSMKGGRVPAMTAGGVDFADTRVLIGPDNLPYSLLGQPEIARLGRVEFEGDVLRIHPTFQPASMD
jgi:predicted aspartyl protease